MTEHILLRHREIPGLDDLETYRINGGYKAFQHVVTSQKPQEVIDLVRASGLRGRGGAGFPTGVKWGFLTKDVFPHYVVANADESEPGTFKDREILEGNPYQFLEGLAICAFAAQANDAYVYCRGEFWDLAHALEQKIEKLYAAGLLGEKIFGTYSLDIHVHLGAGAYICGEETALLESLEGKLGQPPAAPAVPGCRGPLRETDGCEQRGKPLPICLPLSTAASNGSVRSARSAARARRFSRFPAMSISPVTMNFPSGRLSAH